MKPIVLKNITMDFSHKRALDNISLTFENAKIHTILGDNGSGKTTLLSIMSQEKIQTEGQCNLNENKISVVHQQPYIAENQTVLENIILGQEPLHYFVFIDYKKAKHKIETLMNEYNIHVDLNIQASFLNSTQRMYTEFLHALYSDPDFLFLDEPTSSLDFSERKIFYENLKKLAKKNIGVILISHNPEEATLFSDYFYFLKKGKLIHDKITTENAKKILQEEYTLLSEISKDNELKNDAKTMLSVNQLSCTPINLSALFNISFSVKENSITLISGKKESGLLTLEEILTGIIPIEWKGEISFFNNIHFSKSNKEKLNPVFLRKSNISFISSDKTYRDSNPNITVKDMLLINRLQKIETQSFYDNFVSEIINKEQIDINPNEKVSNLSGGMLQRLILERELKEKPKMLFLFEPFTGLDKLSLQKLTDQLEQLAKAITSILILSSYTNKNILSITSQHYKIESGYLKDCNENCDFILEKPKLLSLEGER